MKKYKKKKPEADVRKRKRQMFTATLLAPNISMMLKNELTEFFFFFFCSLSEGFKNQEVREHSTPTKT